MHTVFHHSATLARGISFVLFILGLQCISAAQELEPASTEEKDRYARILVTVEVQDNNFETRRRALAIAEDDALFIWLEALLDSLDKDAKRYFQNRLKVYVSNTKVMKETALVNGGELDVEVLLDTFAIRFDAARLLFPQRITPVPTLILMGENAMGGEGYSVSQDDIAARMLHKYFKNSGFEVFSTTEVEQFFTPDDLLKCFQEGNAAATRLGRALNAEVIVFGETNSTTEGPESAGLAKVKGSADIMVIRVSDGQLLERIKTEAEVEGNNLHAAGLMAIEDAVYKAQDRLLVAAALGCLEEPERQWARLTIRGENVKSVSESITEYLSQVELIQSVELLHRKRDSIIFSVNYTGKISALIDVFLNETQNAVQLEPVQIVDNEMLFQLKGY